MLKKEKLTPNKLNSDTNVIFTVCIDSTVTKCSEKE